MGFPNTRMRRLRATASLRKMTCETRLSSSDLILPLFVRPGTGVKQPIPSMPGNFQFSVDALVEEARSVAGCGVPAIILFGIPETKDATGSGAYDDEAIVCRAIAAVKSACPDLCVIADVCLCEYTDHGHCGLVADGIVDNDATLPLLAKASIAYAEAGADMVAPSDMMDGRVGAIRRGLDEAGHSDMPIMAYSAKYASAFYGPFREAAESAPQFGDRSGYQMDPGNAREALREIALDIEEGADIVMVKPALAYLDILREARTRFDVPMAAYQVSGEFAMVKAAAEQGWLDERRAAMEMLTAIRRAGADLILTYWAKDAVAWLDSE